MEDKKISEAAELLYKGAKMLQFHCQDCGLPLFKHEGRTFCPGCKIEYEIVENQVRKVGEIEEKKEEVKEVREVSVKFSSNFDYVEANLTEVMKKLSEKLLKAESLREMEEIITILNEIIGLSERVKKLRNR